MGRKRATLAVYGSVVQQQHYRVRELAARWGFAESTIIKMFRNEPGVLRLGGDSHGKRSYVSLSIPESVALRVHQRLSEGSLWITPPRRKELRVIRLRDLYPRAPLNVLKLDSALGSEANIERGIMKGTSDNAS